VLLLLKSCGQVSNLTFELDSSLNYSISKVVAEKEIQYCKLNFWRLAGKFWNGYFFLKILNTKDYSKFYNSITDTTKNKVFSLK
jgi:hypothetical protein